MKNKLLMTAMCLFFTVSAFSQYFSTAVESFSTKKPTYITMKNGDEIEGNLRNYKWKKGLISELTMIINDEKVKINPEDIKHMYLPQSGWDKISQANDLMSDATKWDVQDINAEHLKEGYAYFEESKIQLRKEQRSVLLQLLNTSFPNETRVYFDPFANETASVGVAGIKVAGGIDKSYWVKFGDEVAVKVEKKNYEDYWSKLYGNCRAVEKMVKDQKDKWRDFPEMLYRASTECK